MSSESLYDVDMGLDAFVPGLVSSDLSLDTDELDHGTKMHLPSLAGTSHGFQVEGDDEYFNSKNFRRPEEKPKYLECGEPFRSQFLRIDFTPIPGVDDNDELVQKIISFWDFVYSQPELLKVMAEPEEQFAPPELPETAEKEMERKQAEKKKSRTAIHSLNSMPKNAFIMNHIRLAKKYCLEPNPDYQVDKCPAYFTKDKDLLKLAYAKYDDCDPQNQGDYVAKERKRSNLETKKLCSEMERFDKTHPKSFEPPGPNFSLVTQCEMQRMPQSHDLPFMPGTINARCTKAECVKPFINNK